MSEPPAENLSTSHLDPPSKSASSLDEHFAKHRQQAAITSLDDAASSRRPDATAHASRNVSSGASYNASLRYGGGGDAPSVGDSIHSGDDFTVRSESGEGGDSVISFNASREVAPGEEETARLLRGGSQSAFPNPYRKRQQQQQVRQQGPNRVSFAEQLFGKTYDSNSSVVASVVGSISGTVATAGPGVRRKVPRVGANSNYASSSSSNGMSSPSSSNEAVSSLTSEIFTKRLQKFNSIKKNAALLSILTMGVIIFIGACFSLSEIPNGSTAEAEEEARSLGYENDGTASSSFSLGIMDNIHPHPQAAAPIIAAGNYASKTSSQSDPQAASSQQIDWNKVPPHLRGYYSRTFGPPPSSNGAVNTFNDAAYGPNNSYNGLQDSQESEYERSQFANAQAAMAIQSIGKEAVLGFRPMTGRDYHAQGELNKELTSAGMGSGGIDSGGFHSDAGGFSGPMLRKEEFVMQEEQQLWGQQQQKKKNDQPMDSEEQKRIAAQEAALSKASTAEDDARKKREEEVMRLRATAGLTGFYYPQKEGVSSAAEAPAVGANADDAAKQEKQPDSDAVVAAAEAEDVKQKLELVRQRMKEEAEAAQKKDEDARQQAEAAQKKEEDARQQAEDEARQQKAEIEAKQKLEEETRQRNEDDSRQQEEARKREEEAARQQEMARQEAAEKAAKQKLEMLQEQKAEEVRQRNSRPSFAQELLTKYLNVPFQEQTTEVSAPLPPPPPAEKQPDNVPSGQQPIPEQKKPLDKPEQGLPSVSNEQQPVQHDQPQQQDQQSPSQTQNQPPPETPKQPQPPQQGQPPPQQSAQLRLQVQNGQLSFDDWRTKMKQKLHNQIQEDGKKNAPPPPPKPSQAEIKDQVSQKMEEVEQAQSAVLKGESTDLDSIASLQKELSELLAIMGGT
ncbi:hypothetical protein ACHAW6_004945 [Cyclotella cf. meneghiniana]